LPQWFNPLAWLAVRRFEEAAEWPAMMPWWLSREARLTTRALLELGLLELGQRIFNSYTARSDPRRIAAMSRASFVVSHGKDSVMKKLVVIVTALCWRPVVLLGSGWQLPRHLLLHPQNLRRRLRQAEPIPRRSSRGERDSGIATLAKPSRKFIDLFA
jgi:hypothetical protein